MRARANGSIAEYPTIQELIGSVNASAFVGTNLTGELITSGLLVTRPLQHVANDHLFMLLTPCCFVEIDRDSLVAP